VRNTNYFKNKLVTVVGLARSGLTCANLLYDLGAQVYVTDNKDSESTRLNASKLKSENIKVELGRHSQGFIKGKDLIIVSPGVTKDALPVIWAKELNLPIISEVEFAWFLCPATIIAVTGSGGKTTVTTLIGRILEASSKRVFVCGNIGTPFSAEVSKMRSGDFVSLEVSSFQLEKIRDFRPKIAVMLNFSRNHLDRHEDLQEYLDAKKRIFINQQKDDFLVLNRQDPILKELAKEARSKAVFFEESEELNSNQAAATTVGTILGIDKKISLKIFDEFKGLEHRLEFVAEINKIKFINDSKATLVESAIWAIKNISSPIILIAGGRDKGVDYGGILEVAHKRIKEVILIGEAKEKIRAALEKKLLLDEALTLQEAVHKAYSKAKAGDCVLLSPMCSSFDMFRNYEERGMVFKQAVLDLAKQNT
jgi:UDP-N-acetylmuramoylalanine--D-glutamate ligase